MELGVSRGEGRETPLVCSFREVVAVLRCALAP